MKSPEFVCHEGKGNFSFYDSVVESPFVLYRNPYLIGVIAEEGFPFETAVELIQKRVPVQLTGILNDGRSIKANALSLTNTQPPENIEGVEFAAAEGIFLGHAGGTSPDESTFPMTGCFKGEIVLIHDGWEINTIPCPEPDILKNFLQKWRIPVEGTRLQLRHKHSTMVQHEDFAHTVMNLLSIALGTGVSCDRHIFTWANEELEIWRHWTGDEFGPGAIIPDYQLVKFLEQTLPIWQSLSHDQQKALRLARDYINLSARGYVDTRLLQICQSLEFLVKVWGIEGGLSEAESCLLSRLQETRKQWNKDHNKCDVDGFWGSRISSIFEWPKLKAAITQLAIPYGLDLARLGLDLDLLIKERNSVAHSGKLTEHQISTNKQAFRLLTTGQYCLQLLILRMLRYQGPVNHSTKGMTTIVDIEHALTTVKT
jgi:hypothetical protein